MDDEKNSYNNNNNKHIKHQEERKDDEKSPYNLIRNPSLTKADVNDHSLDSNNSLPSLNRSKTWLEKDVHIAILQTNPIESGDGGAGLAVGLEIKRLQDMFFKTTRGLKIFFGVLTQQSLIRCIQRGVQIVHISGHGPYERKLKVEDKYGRLEDLSSQQIGDATKGSGLKLVFVSTCYSEHIAQSFCDAGVPHVVAVNSQVQILDHMAIKFASTFYEGLLTHRKTVQESFDNSKAELLLEYEIDCCCRHEGHISECRCPICKNYRCCSQHHGINSGNRCSQIIDIPCCQPAVPHKPSDKFLLMPVNNKAHNEKILSTLPNAQCERINNSAPTNIGQSNIKIIGRSRDVRILVDFLHADSENQGDVVIIYGRPKIGLTTVALQVGRFFIRPWYQAIFLGGVFKINLQNCHDPNFLYSYIGQAMNTIGTKGSYSYWDNVKKEYFEYNIDIQGEINDALSGDDITDPIEIYDDNNNIHYILFDQHKNHKELLQYKLPKKIYIEFERKIKMLPMEFYISNEEVAVRRIKFTPPNEENILQEIKKSGSSSDMMESQKLLIIDHINFPKLKMKQFLQKIKRLIENVKCKLLLVCHDKIESIIHEIQQQNVTNCMLKQRLWRIKPISKNDSAKLLLEQARQLYEFDFHNINTPATTEEASQFPLFEWLSKSPALIQQCSTVLDRKVPFCVIINMLNEKPNKWLNSLDEWQQPLKLQQDELKDAINSLTALLTKINFTKAIWSGYIRLLINGYIRLINELCQFENIKIPNELKSIILNYYCLFVNIKCSENQGVSPTSKSKSQSQMK